MATTEQFSLRWTNFHSNITAGFHDLLEANDMVDVTLAVEGHFLQAHKIVLSICSPYFKQLFRMNPCKHPIVILKDVTHGNMKDILEFMYLGEVNVLRENLSAFLRTAELLQVKGLTGDDSSDTSSKKDDKTDSICDNEEEPDYAHMMEPDGSTAATMPQYPPEVPSPPQQQQHHQHRAVVPTAAATSNVKRLSRQPAPTATNNNFKKIKQEATGAPTVAPAKAAPPNNNASTPDNNATTTDCSQTTNEDEAEYIEMPSKLDYEKDGLPIKKEPFYDSSAAFNNAMADMNNLQDQASASCVACGKMMRKSSIKRHMYDVHFPTRQMPCDICHKLFKTANSLTTHLITIHKRVKSNHRPKSTNRYIT